jgi:secreted trypsin-like serine protease
VAAEEPRESTEPSAQIIGGSRVTIEQYPWQVAIARAPAVAPPGDGPLERHICGGTLVAPTIVITAAHCVRDGGKFSPASRFSVISGRTELSSNQGVETGISGYRYFVDNANEPLF